ncbi:MAG: HAMP domain-containing histidine kinase [Deltaproteobacteria bacterium]|nr:HAMP domain-containing histidine kinase [Deltaproteobacteria bacterium]
MTEAGHTPRALPAPRPGHRLQRLEELTDRFVPPEILRRSPEDARRARFAVAFAFLAGGFFVVALVVQAPLNSPLVAALNALSAVLCFGAPLAVRRFGRADLVCHGVLALGFCKYMSVAILLRGPGFTGASVMMAQLPLFATFLTGVRAGAVWAVLVTLGGAGIGVLGYAGLIVDHLPAPRLLNDHFVLTASTWVLYCIAALFEHHKDAAQVHAREEEAQRRAAELARMEAISRAQLLEARRFSVLGRIAAATAHEINNPLTVVMSNLPLVARLPALAAGGDGLDAIRDALDGAQRIARIVEDMRLCTELDDTPLDAVSVTEAVRLALELAQPQLGAHTPVRTHLPGDLPPVRADVPRLARALCNLVVNAAQAAHGGETRDPEISIEARLENAHVLIEVRDRGRGIPAELLDRVREPFFTTRPVGQGTGLGLAICEGIVQSFGGTLTLESRPGLTVARVTLPACTNAPRGA